MSEKRFLTYKRFSVQAVIEDFHSQNGFRSSAICIELVKMFTYHDWRVTNESQEIESFVFLAIILQCLVNLPS